MPRACPTPTSELLCSGRASKLGHSAESLDFAPGSQGITGCPLMAKVSPLTGDFHPQVRFI